MIAIVGAGRTNIGRLEGWTAEDLYDQACLAAIKDSGLDPRDLDGVITANSRVSPAQNHADVVANRLGIGRQFTLTVGTGGANTLRAVQIAKDVVASGRARAVLVAAADNLLTGLSSDDAVASLARTGYGELESPFGVFAPALFALTAQRHHQEFGSTSEDLAAVAVMMRENAARTHGAHLQTRITIADVESSPLISTPLRRLDCAPLSDGGGAVIVADQSLATRASIAWSAYGEAHGPPLPYSSDVSRREVLTEAVGKVLGDNDGLDGVHFLFIYDPFTIETIVCLEAIGLCRPGDGPRVFADGYVSSDGPMPLNPHGGLLSFGHPGRAGAMLQVVEAVRSLRGADVPARALVTAEGAMLSTYAAAVLERK